MTLAIAIICLIVLMLPTVRTLREAYADGRVIDLHWSPAYQPRLRHGAKRLVALSIRREWLRLLKHAVAAVCVCVALSPLYERLGVETTQPLRTAGLFVVVCLISLTSWLDYRGRNSVTQEMQELKRIKELSQERAAE
jgi:hypothetical protein